MTATEFEAAIGHQSDDHTRSYPPNVLRRRIYDATDCGWWWCGADLTPEQWRRLHEALQVFKNKKLNPKGLDILHVVTPWIVVDQMGPHRDLLNELDRVAREVRRKLWPKGRQPSLKYEPAGEVKDDPYTLLTAMIERFAPIVSEANAARPVGQDPRLKIAPRAALARKDELNRISGRKRWTDDAVRAALVLTGIEKADADRLRTARRRPKAPK